MFKSEKVYGAHPGPCVSDFCGDEVCGFSDAESDKRERAGKAFDDAQDLALQEVLHG